MTRASRSGTRIVAALVAIATLSPSVAMACTACLFGAYGDRTFNWAFLGLIAMPFCVAGAIGGVLMYRYGFLRTRRTESLAADEETT